MWLADVWNLEVVCSARACRSRDNEINGCGMQYCTQSETCLRVLRRYAVSGYGQIVSFGCSCLCPQLLALKAEQQGGMPRAKRKGAMQARTYCGNCRSRGKAVVAEIAGACEAAEIVGACEAARLVGACEGAETVGACEAADCWRIAELFAVLSRESWEWGTAEEGGELQLGIAI